MAAKKPPTVDQRAESVTMIPIGSVHPAPDNPRQELGDLSELRDSIKAQGILQPLVVVPHGADGQLMLEGHYMVVIGHRRLAAAAELELAWVPCIVRKYEDAQRQEVALVENLQRVDLSPLEEAAAFAKLTSPPIGLSQRQVADRVGRSQAHVSKRLALTALTPPAIAKLDSAGITLEEAVELAGATTEVQALVVGERQAYGSMRDRVKKWSKFAARRHREAELTNQGLTVIPSDEYGRPATHDFASITGDRKGENSMAFVHMGEKEHAALPCHAVYVNEAGNPVPVCAKPASHLPAARATEAKKFEDANARALARGKADEKARREAMKARGLVLETALSEPDLVYATSVVLSSWRVSDCQIACRILGIEASKRQYGGGDWPAALAGYAEKSQKAALTALMALALGVGEAAVQGQFTGYSDDRARRHIERLVGAGYEPLTADRRYLKKGKVKDSAPEAEPVDEREALRASLFGADGWGKWERGSTHPQGATQACSPSIEDRSWDWGRESETPEAGHLQYRGICRHCDWVGPVREMHDGENAAVEDAHDHSFPGWRELPVLPERTSLGWTTIDHSKKREAAREAAIRAAIKAGYPEDFIARRGPVRGLRDGIGTRHVPGYSPFGGYALAVVAAEEGAGEPAPISPASDQAASSSPDDPREAAAERATASRARRRRVVETDGEPPSVAEQMRRAQAELDAEGPLRTDAEVGDFGDPVVPLDQQEACPFCVKLVNGKCRSCGREVRLEYVDGHPVTKPVASSVA